MPAIITVSIYQYARCTAPGIPKKVKFPKYRILPQDKGLCNFFLHRAPAAGSPVGTQGPAEFGSQPVPTADAARSKYNGARAVQTRAPRESCYGSESCHDDIAVLLDRTSEGDVVDVQNAGGVLAWLGLVANTQI